MLYELTEQNIKDGHLTEADFSSGIAYPVTVFYQDEFPYFGELAENGFLPAEKIAARTDAIYKKLQEKIFF